MTAFEIAAFCGHHSILEVIMYYAFTNGGKKKLKKVINKLNP
jgi:hypothetical protein